MRSRWTALVDPVGILDVVPPDHDDDGGGGDGGGDDDDDEVEDGDIAWWRTKFIQRSSNFP